MALGPSFYKKLVKMSNELGMKPEDVINVMCLESGLDPAAHNKNGNASGLVQFMPSTLKNIGFKGTHSEFRDLDAEKQLDWVKKLIQDMMSINGGPFKSAAQYYVGNFLPIALKLPGIRSNNPSTIICSKNPTTPHLPGISLKLESIYYNANPGLDVDKDGSITFGDIQSILAKVRNGGKYKTAIQALNQVGYQSDSDDSDKDYRAQVNKYNLDGFKLLNQAPAQNSNVEDLLSGLLKQVAANRRQDDKLYKKYLDKHEFIIKLNSSFTNSIECARIINSVFKKCLFVKSATFTNDENVEVSGTIHGPISTCENVISEISEAIAEVYNVSPKVIIGKASNYQPLSLKTSMKEFDNFRK